MKPYMWAILTAVTWGCVPIIEKMGLVRVPVWVGLFYRCLGVIVGIILLMVFRFDEIRKAVMDVPSGWHYLLIGGFLASIVGQVFFYFALRSGETSTVTPIAAAYPLMTFVLGVILLKEGVTLTKLAGVFFVILGVVLLK